MYLTIDKYKKNINLDKHFKPSESGVVETDKNIIVNYLLKTLGREVLTESYIKKRKLLEHLLVELAPGYKLTEKFHSSLDTLLQMELKRKQIINAKLLPRMADGIGCDELSKIAVWKGDITTLKIDAIVNAANNQLLGCFVPFHKCIDNVIHCAAGPRLREDCYTVMNLQGKVEPTGKAKVTRAYNLPAKYVIHTVGPIVRDELTKFNRVDLSNSYLSCLEISKKVEKIRSIAFCSIATGIYGFPFEEAAKIAFDTVTTWLTQNPNELNYGSSGYRVLHLN